MFLANLYRTFEFWLCRKLGLVRFKHLGKCSVVKYGTYGDPHNIFIGDYVYIGENAQFWGLGGISIGKGTIIGPNVVIRSSNHNYKTGGFLPYGPSVDKRPVTLGENCRIGDMVLIAPGTVVGEGCVVGMGSVLSGTIPPYSVVVGNPAKVIKERDVEEYKRLKKEGRIYMKYKRTGSSI